MFAILIYMSFIENSQKNYLKMMKHKSDYELGNIGKATEKEAHFFVF